MKNYDFELIFKVPSITKDINEYLDSLYESGCDDATISTGQFGMIALSFSREANSAKEAIKNAITDVKKAIKNAKLVEATPDIVSISDVASILGYSRQYIRKLFEENLSYLPSPIHIGNPSVWHLNEILSYIKEVKKNKDINELLFEVSRVTKEINRSRV